MIVCVTSARPAGCTFLEWSINWLSGQRQYFVAAENQSIPLTHAPLTTHDYSKNTAHNHRKNHPRGPQEVEQTLLAFLNSQSRFNSFYPIANEIDFWCDKLDLNIATMTTQNWQQVVESQQQELNGIGKLCQEHNIKTVYVTESKFSVPYFICTRLLPPWAYKQNLNELEYYKFLVNINDSKLTPWDLRELLALNIKPMTASPFVDYVNMSQPHYRLTVEDLWFDGKRSLPMILDWLELKLDKSRLLSWQNVYTKWQQSQLDYVRMCWQLPVIVDAIVNNHYYPLPRLSLIWEAVIQHCLIYQHGLNLRNWQLKQFPTNTQDLHTLLEPNTHQLI